MPYSVAKIVSISPGAMPPFTLETHTINAKLNLPILPKGVFCVSSLAQVCYARAKNIYSLVDSGLGWEGGLIVDNLVNFPTFWSLVHIAGNLSSAQIEHGDYILLRRT